MQQIAIKPGTITTLSTPGTYQVRLPANFRSIRAICTNGTAGGSGSFGYDYFGNPLYGGSPGSAGGASSFNGTGGDNTYTRASGTIRARQIITVIVGVAGAGGAGGGGYSPGSPGADGSPGSVQLIAA